MNTDLTGKVALVTGGGSGIGAATCRTLAQAGAAIAILDLRPGPAQTVAEAITAEGGRAIAIAADVTDELAVSAAVVRTVEELGGLQIVFANAGINGMQTPIEEMTLDEWRATIDTNLTGTFLTTKHSIPHLRAAGGGAIVVTASVNGTRLFSAPGYSAYSTSKAGQATFARMAATELARWNIRVNTIIPGSIRTNIGERTYRRNLEAITYDVKMPEKFPPLGARVADPTEVADLVLYLVSDASRYVTGTEVVIDAGLTLLRG
ncbi:MAG: 3-oxoacyl-[acyl-carrier protein] reductase [uncultured Thermomicrobiales bacterium]|uniref:3-oxoacyl-[acyl-carrier protein] reductase n=1 Tax=uncultured Thermomicrobiales bacterium TaxID=1645740 RepID=A0A6J4UI41_9BACT|nr:MAG: 3-oxoacyl-[acyl-carrier protein] reductase [uncultured Thermomicrobiales bacterium]